MCPLGPKLRVRHQAARPEPCEGPVKSPKTPQGLLCPISCEKTKNNKTRAWGCPTPTNSRPAPPPAQHEGGHGLLPWTPIPEEGGGK